MTDASMTATSPYRCSDDVWLTGRRAALSLARERAAPTLPDLTRATVASVARLLAGAAGLGGALAVATLACLQRPPLATYTLLGTVGAAFAIVAAGRLGGALAARRPHELPPLPALTGSSAVDRAALEARDPLADLDARVARLRRLRGASLALPLVAMSLLGPLTLHFPFAATADVSARDYGEWIQLSGMIVGIAHLVLAGMSVRYVSRLLAAQDTGVPLVLHREWMFALGIVVVASCLPGIVFLAIPPVLTAVTGVVLVPMMFYWAHAALRDEARATDAARAARDSAAEPSAPAYEAGPPPSDTAPPVFGRTASA